MASSDTLRKIKRAVLSGNVRFTEKAVAELEADHLAQSDVVEAIVDAVAIYKVIRSRSPLRSKRGELLYVIIGTNLDGLPIYTKGKFIRMAEVDVFYVLISSKRSTE